MATAFTVWAAVGGLFILLGLYCLVAKKPCDFWANGKQKPVEDVRGYNRAMALLWVVYGAVFILIGLPMLSETDTLLMALSPVGTMAITIGAMIVYTQVIDKKFRGGKK